MIGVRPVVPRTALTQVRIHATTLPAESPSVTSMSSIGGNVPRAVAAYRLTKARASETAVDIGSRGRAKWYPVTYMPATRAESMSRRYHGLTYPPPSSTLTATNRTPFARAALKSIAAPPGCWYDEMSMPTTAPFAYGGSVAASAVPAPRPSSATGSANVIAAVTMARRRNTDGTLHPANSQHFPDGQTEE